MDSARQPILEVDQLGLTLGQKQLLAPTSFQLGPGECAALTGPNGSGKTTLLRIVTDKQPATGGTHRWCGVATTDLSLVMGYTPFYENMTVGEHLGLIAASWDLPEYNVQELVYAFDIQHIVDSFIEELSSGETQLLSLCMGLLRPAKVIILDEPEQRLDTRRRETLATILKDHKEAGQAVLLASHDATLVTAVADHVLEL